MVTHEEYFRRTSGCGRGVRECLRSYKRDMKKYLDECRDNGMNECSPHVNQPVRCDMCFQANEYHKLTLFEYDNMFYGKARQLDAYPQVDIHLHHSGWHTFDFGTEKINVDGREVYKGVRNSEDYENLFKLSVRPLNGKVPTPKEGDYIAGVLSRNTLGRNRGKLVWEKWYKQSETMNNFVKLWREGVKSHAIRVMECNERLILASMVYDANRIVNCGKDREHKTPVGCEPHCNEQWLLCSIVMYAVCGMVPENRDAFEEHGGLSRCGTLNYFTFLENISSQARLIELTQTPCPEVVMTQPIREVELGQNVNWRLVYNDVKQLGWLHVKDTKLFGAEVRYRKTRYLNYKHYYDGRSIDFVPYDNSHAPYFNGHYEGWDWEQNTVTRDEGYSHYNIVCNKDFPPLVNQQSHVGDGSLSLSYLASCTERNEDNLMSSVSIAASDVSDQYGQAFISLGVERCQIFIDNVCKEVGTERVVSLLSTVNGGLHVTRELGKAFVNLGSERCQIFVENVVNEIGDEKVLQLLDMLNGGQRPDILTSCPPPTSIDDSPSGEKIDELFTVPMQNDARDTMLYGGIVEVDENWVVAKTDKDEKSRKVLLD